jgi:hypothetical protein
MHESSKTCVNPMMLRLLGLECRTARTSIYSEKAEIKSPRELLASGSAGINDCLALRGEEKPVSGAMQTRMPALPGVCREAPV